MSKLCFNLLHTIVFIPRHTNCVFLLAEHQQAFIFSQANIYIYPFSFTDCCVPGSTSSRVMGYGIHTQSWLLFQRSFICAHASGPIVWAPARLNLSCRRVRLQSHESWHEKTLQISLKRLKKEQRHLSQQNWNIVILVILPSETRGKTAPGLKSLGDRSSALRWTDQQPIDYIQSSELSSSLLYLVVSPLWARTRTPTPSLHASPKVSEAWTLNHCRDNLYACSLNVTGSGPQGIRLKERS